MIEIKNRLPTKPNRWKITHESDSSQEYITWDYADEPTETGTPINRGLIVGMYNDMTPCGIVKTFSSKEEREGYLLCDGSSVMGVDYPDLIGKLKSYDLYQYKPIEDITGYATTTKGNIYVANGKFFMMSNYTSTERQKVWVSDDGETWEQILANYSFTNGNDALQNVIYTNGTYYLFISQSNSPSVFYGSNLNSLTRARIFSGTSRVFVTTGNIGNTLVAILHGTSSPVSAYVYYSTNGSQWTLSNFPTNNVVNTTIEKLKTINSKIYFGFETTSEKRLYSSSDGITWSYTSLTDDTNVPQSYDYPYSGYIWRLNGTTLQRTQDYSTWSTVKTYSTDVTGSNLYISSNGKAFLSRVGTTYTNIPSLYSPDMENFEPLITEYTSSNYISTPIVSNGTFALCTAGGYMLRYDINYNNPRLVLPTLNDDTNQLYGYIKTEVE